MHSPQARLATSRPSSPRPIAPAGPRRVQPASLLRSTWPLLVGWLVLLATFWALGELAASALSTADLAAVQGVAAERSSALALVAHTLSALASGYVVIPLAVLSCVLLHRRGRRRAALAVALSTIGASMLSTLDKLLVGRPRPPVEHLEAVGSASFPSGHATSAAALYIALLLAFLASRPPAGVRIAAIASTALLLIGVAFSRIYLGVHYPSDVIAGLLLGGGWSLFAASVIGRRSAA